VVYDSVVHWSGEGSKMEGKDEMGGLRCRK
jgi:hypothetical protein